MKPAQPGQPGNKSTEQPAQTLATDQTQAMQTHVHPRTPSLLLQLLLPLLFVAALLLFLQGCAAQEAPTTEQDSGGTQLTSADVPTPEDLPFHKLSYDEALALAERSGRPVFIDFFATWCPPCKQLERSTWPDADVRNLLTKDTIAIKVDTDQEPKLAGRFGIQSIPTLVLVEANGKEIQRRTGFVDPKGFQSWVKKALN